MYLYRYLGTLGWLNGKLYWLINRPSQNAQSPLWDCRASPLGGDANLNQAQKEGVSIGSRLLCKPVGVC